MSSDDTSVAVLETSRKSEGVGKSAKLHFHEKVTANNAQYRGIHPIVALESHNSRLAPLIIKALNALPPSSTHPSIPVQYAEGAWLERVKPDFVTVTRGPGLLPCLSTGLNCAKGLAVAWQVPLLGVNHMQAHALTPRLVNALEVNSDEVLEPQFPFLSLLVSGGHTMLVHSKQLTHHTILATTTDVAIGDVIDKAARQILPEEVIQSSDEMMYGRLLEQFAFPAEMQQYAYAAPATRAEEMSRKSSSWGWALAAPLAETRSGSKSKAMEFSFSGLGSAIKRICKERETTMTHDERIDLAREALRVAFEHLASRTLMALEQLNKVQAVSSKRVSTLVVSGGVASNRFLRKLYVRTRLKTTQTLNANESSKGSAHTSIPEALNTSFYCSHRHRYALITPP